MIQLLGVLHMRDENGLDDKLLGIPVGEPRFDRIADLEVLPQHRLVEIEHFFATDKQIEGKTSVVTAHLERPHAPHQRVEHNKK